MTFVWVVFCIVCFMIGHLELESFAHRRAVIASPMEKRALTSPKPKIKKVNRLATASADNLVPALAAPQGASATLAKKGTETTPFGVDDVMAAKRASWGERRFKCTCGLVVDICSDSIVVKVEAAKFAKIPEGWAIDHSASASSRGPWLSE